MASRMSSEPLRALIAELDAGRPAVLCTVVRHLGSTPQEQGARLLLRADGGIVGTVGGGAIEHEVIAAARDAAETGRTALIERKLGAELGMCCGGRMDVLIEPMRPRPVALLLGGGHIGAAVADLAETCGFTAVVVDPREAFARPPRGGRSLCLDPDRHLDELPLGPETYALITTHSHRLDEELVRRLVDRPLRWLGLIASRAKVARFRERLLARGLAPASFDRLRAPAGLPIGGRSPEEIALSVVAEWVAVRRGGEALRLLDPAAEPESLDLPTAARAG